MGKWQSEREEEIAAEVSSDARDYVHKIDPKVVLIDGQRLAELMIEFGLGVTATDTYQVNRVDLDYFEEE